MTNLTKKDQQAYASLAHAMTPTWPNLGNVDNNFNFWSWKSWIYVATSIVAVVRCGLAVMLHYKLQVLSATVAGLTFVSRANALPRELNYFQTEPPRNLTENVFIFCVPTDLTLDISVIFLLLF